MSPEKMILLLSAGGGNQEGAFGPFLDYSQDAGTGDVGSPVGCFYWGYLLPARREAALPGVGPLRRQDGGRALRCAPGTGQRSVCRNASTA